jgi:hypothetical protein
LAMRMQFDRGRNTQALPCRRGLHGVMIFGQSRSKKGRGIFWMLEKKNRFLP